MPHTESTLSWLANLNRRDLAPPQAFADRRSADGADGSAEFRDELQKRLGQVVFSTLCEKLGRPPLKTIDEACGADTVTPDHLRAARALLNWSMSDLAEESGLSVSTIKRVEQEPQDVTRRSYELVIETLRIGGIRFLTLDDGTVAVAKATPPGCPSQASD